MDRYDPNEWTDTFVRSNMDFCISLLKDTNDNITEFLKNGEYEVAVAGMDRMINGMIVIQNAGIANMKPFICINSFNLGTIVVCGLDRATESKRKEIATANFLDAIDYSSGKLKDYAKEAINLLKSGRSIDYIKSELCPNFPEDIIDSMYDMSRRLQELK